MRSRIIAHLTRVRTTQLCYLYHLIKDWTIEMLHALKHLKHGMNQRTIFYACTEYHSYIMPINGRKDEVFEMPKVLRNSKRKKKKKNDNNIFFLFLQVRIEQFKKRKKKKKRIEQDTASRQSSLSFSNLPKKKTKLQVLRY